MTTYSNPLTIVIIGSGNVGSQLIELFCGSNDSLLQIYSRSDREELQEKYDNKLTIVDNLAEINQDADLYIITVNDEEISSVIANWPFRLKNQQVLVHTSGATGSTVLSNVTTNFGVIWPIHSILKGQPINWELVPFVLTGSNDYTIGVISKIVQNISNNTTYSTDEERKQLHLTAVILNNFPNHIYSLAEQYLEDNNLPFDIFLPIINQTVERLSTSSPSMLQTGPAVRNDTKTILEHKILLKNNRALLRLYSLLTMSIQSNE